MERWTIYFSGQAQGVGFGYTTRQRARAGDFDVSGFVRNLDDVRLEAGGVENSGTSPLAGFPETAWPFFRGRLSGDR